MPATPPRRAPTSLVTATKTKATSPAVLSSPHWRAAAAATLIFCHAGGDGCQIRYWGQIRPSAGVCESGYRARPLPHPRRLRGARFLALRFASTPPEDHPGWRAPSLVAPHEAEGARSHEPHDSSLVTAAETPVRGMIYGAPPSLPGEVEGRVRWVGGARRLRRRADPGRPETGCVLASMPGLTDHLLRWRGLRPTASRSSWRGQGPEHWQSQRLLPRTDPVAAEALNHRVHRWVGRPQMANVGRM